MLVEGLHKLLYEGIHPSILIELHGFLIIHIADIRASGRHGVPDVGIGDVELDGRCVALHLNLVNPIVKVLESMPKKLVEVDARLLELLLRFRVFVCLRHVGAQILLGGILEGIEHRLDTGTDLLLVTLACREARSRPYYKRNGKRQSTDFENCLACVHHYSL